MNIFRRYYRDDTYKRTNGLFIMDLANMGFCLPNGDPVTPDMGSTSQNIQLKWGLDTNYENDNHAYITYYHDVTFGYGLNINLSNRNYKTPIGSGQPGSLCFIPLNNNGFLLTATNDSSIVSSSTTFPLLTSKDTWTKQDYNMNICNFIGIKNNFYPNQSYVYAVGMGQPYATSLVANKHVDRDFGISFGYNKTVDKGFKRFTTDTNTEIYSEQFDMGYYMNNVVAGTQNLNVNKNVCSLIRFPFENKYINDLYLCTTCPVVDDDPEGHVFSFGGRNFFGLFGNVMVELPSN